MKLLLLGLVLVVHVSGHGRLMEPPARNVLWRFGYSSPINYNDNELFCGGYGVQYDKYDGKCGVCGDSWGDEQPRKHEAGGEFGQGVIGKRFVAGEKMTVEIDLTANHWGHFVLKICPMNDKGEIVSQDCLDKNPLYLADNPAEYKYKVTTKEKKDYLTYEVLLPKGLTCKQCVVQWTYYTGNTWGTCKNGTAAVGCGNQEMFRNCADIMIVSNTATNPGVPDVPSAIYFRDKDAKGGRRQLVVRADVCLPVGIYRSMPDMAKWCQQNCLKYPPSCPKSMCQCLGECKAIGSLANQEGTDVYCHRNCLRYPSTCPSDVCNCTIVDPLGNNEQGSDIIQEYFK